MSRYKRNEESVIVPIIVMHNSEMFSFICNYRQSTKSNDFLFQVRYFKEKKKNK